MVTADSDLATALAGVGADVVHAGLFDYAGMFRERRLATADLLTGADTAVFANVLPKWDIAEAIRFPGPYGSETIAYDPASVRPWPFEAKAAAVIADYTGPQASIMPRTLLARQIARARAMGFEPVAASEFEFIVLAETAGTLRAKGFTDLALYAPDNRCWSGVTAAVQAGFVAQLEATLRAGGIDPFSLSVELGPGCFEATLRHAPAMRAADDAAFFRLFTRAFCRTQGLTASFMSLTGSSFPGIGGHVAMSLADRRDGRNVFGDAGAEHGLSATARSFLAGLIDGLPDLFAMIAGTVNAYRRFAPGSWAPKTMSWAPGAYAAAVRTAAETPATARLELRLPGSDMNPWLTLAAMLAAGLDGVERKLPLAAPPISSGGPDEIPTGVERLPRDLFDAAARLKASRRARALFGDAFVDHYAAVCEAEDAALRRAVSAEEVRRYLEA
jgi:glutamine synthetase